jgi:hypothetical protein
VSGNEEASVPESACGDGTVRFAIFSKENGRDSVAVERRTETSALLAVSLPFLFHNLCFLFFFFMASGFVCDGGCLGGHNKSSFFFRLHL